MPLAHLALFTANAILGVGSVVSKIGLAGCNPVIFALLRELMAAPLLFAMSLVHKRLDSPAANPSMADTMVCTVFTTLDALQFLAAGVLLFGTNLCYIVGVKVLGATPAAIWQSSLPVFTLCMGVLVGIEEFTLLKVVGVLLAFAGCAFVSLWSHDPTSTEGTSPDQLTGNAIFLLQILSLAGFFVAEKPLLRRWTPLATLALAYGIASALMLIAAIAINSSPELLALICPCASHPPHVPVSRALSQARTLVAASASLMRLTFDWI